MQACESVIDLAEEIKRGNVTFIVGSAVSMGSPTHLPSAGRIVKCVLQALTSGLGVPRSHIDAAMSVQFEGLFSSLLKCMTPEEALKPILLLAQPHCGITPRPNAIHRELAQYSIRTQHPLITTNYDRCLETAVTPYLPALYTPAGYVLAAQKLRSSSGIPGVLKLHGHIKNSQSMIIAVEQTSRTTHRDLRRALHTALAGRTLCAVGYSGLDIDLFPLIIKAEWERAFWIVEPQGTRGTGMEGTCDREAAPSSPSLGRLLELEHVANTSGRSAEAIAMDIFGTNFLRSLFGRSSAAPLDPDSAERYAERLSQSLIKVWSELRSTQRLVAFGLVLNYCGEDAIALDYLNSDDDQLGGLHAALGESACLHTLGRFGDMKRRFAARACRPQATRSELFAARRVGVDGEAQRMSIGRPPIALLLLFMPYYLVSAYRAIRALRASKHMASVAATKSAAEEWAADDAYLDASVRETSMIAELLRVAPAWCNLALNACFGFSNDDLVQRWQAIREDARRLGSRDHYLNATRHLAYLQETEVDECRILRDCEDLVGLLGSEFSLLTRPGGVALAFRDAGDAACEDCEYDLAFHYYARAAEIARDHAAPLTAFKGLMGMSHCQERQGNVLEAATMRWRAARTLWDVQGTGNKLHSAWTGACCLPLLLRSIVYRQYG